MDMNSDVPQGNLVEVRTGKFRGVEVKKASVDNLRRWY